MAAILPPLMGKPTSSFTCNICNKVFYNEKTQIRHVRYCRKKADHPSRSRKRSCARCSTAKTYCDCAYPSCSRCLEKNIVCLYQHDQKLSSTTARKDRSDSAQQQFHTSPSSSDDSASPDPISGTSLLHYYDSSSTSDSDRLGIANGYQLASLPSPLFSNNLSLLSVASEHAHLRVHTLPDMIHHEKSLFPEILSYDDSRWSLDFSNIPLLVQSPIPRAPRAFSPKHQRYRRLSLTRKYVVCVLNTYPQMLLSAKELPPFVHPKLQSLSTDVVFNMNRSSSSDPLTTCAGIMAMWSVKNASNTAFIWRSIRSEQERLFEECPTYDDHNAVAALQAICVYLLLRLSETDEDATDFDIPLISTMTKITQQVQGITLKYNKAPTWKGWLLVESLRRTIFVLFIIDILFDISPGTQPYCCEAARHLAQMPLPCHKNIWRSQTELEWEWEYTAHCASKYQRLTFSNLLQHGEEDGSAGNLLDDWLANMDDFGTLIVSVASLLEADGYTMA
ncbi:hypothetical protein ACMFMG_006455 [Clarireedia jacksonii]